MDVTAVGWEANWAWSVPVIAVTVVIQVLGTGLIRRAAERPRAATERYRELKFYVTVMMVALASTLLLASAAIIWAVTFYLLGAVPTGHAAMLYSLGALTSYGHAAVFLDPRWQLLGAIESLNGMILLGLTSASLYSVIRDIRTRATL